ncbi:hypothetical protein, partial [Echinicola sediminis]
MISSEYISKFLSLEQPMDENPIRYSSLILLLKSARKLFGCDLNTGKYQKNEFTEENVFDGTFLGHQFTAVIDYLILLEQIGSIFKPKNTADHKHKIGIFRALKYFSSLNDKKINAIVSLRNSLTHRFGRATEKNPKSGSPRKFILSIERNTDIVSLPKKDWTRIFSDKEDHSSTTIHIIDFVENVYQNICQDNKMKNLETSLLDGLEELNSRNTII